MTQRVRDPGRGVPSGQIEEFCALFLRWNARINLSAAETRNELDEHVADCLAFVALLGDANRLLDVGAGGGFPSVIAAIARPDIQVTALEPIRKKHSFLRTAVRELELANLLPLAERLDAHAARDYDAAVSRATFDLAEWLMLGLERVRPGGVAFGFEALPRSDLPAKTVRVHYPLGNKTRAIVSLRRS